MLAVTHKEIRPGVALVLVTGKMMMGEDSGQVDALVGQLLDSGYQNIVFDLSGLTHIDSTGIGRFIASYNRVMQVDGASLHMAAATGIVRSAFRVTKLDTVFPFFETVESALQ
jgi:anti-anti-sigma factor